MDYKIKYLKYKQKYIDLKKNKYGGDHIEINLLKSTTGMWRDNNNIYDGKMDGNITIDFSKNKKIEIEEGVWNGSWNEEESHYIGKFTDKTNKIQNQEVEVIGEWKKRSFI